MQRRIAAIGFIAAMLPLPSLSMSKPAPAPSQALRVILEETPGQEEPVDDVDRDAFKATFIAKLNAEMLRARQVKPGMKPEVVVAIVKANIGFGCMCSDWSWQGSNSDLDGGDVGSMYPLPAEGVPRLPKIHGEFRLVGHLEEKKRSGYSVYNEPRPAIAPYDDGWDLDAKLPVFYMTDWCWDGGHFDWEVDDVLALVQDNRVCAGVNLKALRQQLKKEKRIQARHK
jgi:hypothetical protein